MNTGDKITLDIASINSEGEGIARRDEGKDGVKFVVFVPGALIGERVVCRVERASKNYAAASMLEIVESSPARVEPGCPSYGRCGGCQLQHASYGAQTEMKREILLDAMRRIGKFTDIDAPPCVPSPDEWGYRNKTTLPVGRHTGYYERRSHRIVPFEKCPVLKPSLEKLMSDIISAHLRSGLKGYDERKGSGDIRAIAARCGECDGAERTLSGVVASRDLGHREFGVLRDIHQKLMSSDRSLVGSALNVKTSRDNFIWGPLFKQLCGGRFITARLGDYGFKLDISSFFQINAPQAERIFDRARDIIRSFGAKRVLELYSGTGSLTAYIAGVCESVDAVEEWRPAIKLMGENMERNGAGNVRVFPESAEGFMSGGNIKPGCYDAIILDPPRTGALEAVIDGIALAAPKQILYISCNPATLARDAARLAEGGKYGVTALEAYDMFPQTSHVESVCVMERRT